MRFVINKPFYLSQIIFSDSVIRRKILKKLNNKLSLRPLIVFIIFLSLEKFFLDGYSIYIFCKMRMVYETMIDIKFKIKDEL